MEKYSNETNQPETAYDTPKLYEFLRGVSEAELHVLRTDATEGINELTVFLRAIEHIQNEDPNQYELEV